jgi:hypothetical protein
VQFLPSVASEVHKGIMFRRYSCNVCPAVFSGSRSPGSDVRIPVIVTADSGRS